VPCSGPVKICLAWRGAKRPEIDFAARHSAADALALKIANKSCYVPGEKSVDSAFGPAKIAA